MILVDRKDCVLWHKSIRADGYGNCWYEGRVELAHRVVWAITFNHGVLPDLCVLHRCDVRACVFSGHLFLGTQLENIQDMVAKKRNRGGVGIRNRHARLTTENVESIRQAPVCYGSQKALAKRFGVSREQIRRIVNGENWSCS